MVSSRLFLVALAAILQMQITYGNRQHVAHEAVCSQVTNERPTRDCRWHANLDVYVDQKILKGCRVVAFQIKWFNGRWSGWYVPGVNDIDWKVNTGLKRCNGIVISHNTMRRIWSYFSDHYHTYIKCCPRN